MIIVSVTTAVVCSFLTAVHYIAYLAYREVNL